MDSEAPCSLTPAVHAKSKNKAKPGAPWSHQQATVSGPALKRVWSGTLLPGGACHTGYSRPDLWEKEPGRRLESGARRSRREIGGSSPAQGAGGGPGRPTKSRAARRGLCAPPPPRREPSPPTSPKLPWRRSGQSRACSRRHRPPAPPDYISHESKRARTGTASARRCSFSETSHARLGDAPSLAEEIAVSSFQGLPPLTGGHSSFSSEPQDSPTTKMVATLESCACAQRPWFLLVTEEKSRVDRDRPTYQS